MIARCQSCRELHRFTPAQLRVHPLAKRGCYACGSSLKEMTERDCVEHGKQDIKAILKRELIGTDAR